MCSGFQRESGRLKLFSGTNSKDRFAHLLMEVLSNLTDQEICLLGCNIDDVGTHSNRKGSSSYCLGEVGGPNPISVFLRMGQSLGKLKDRYIFAAEGADQLVGRMVTGLNFCDEFFAILPPHYRKDTLDALDNDFWNNDF
jgi:hypothetical protein